MKLRHSIRLKARPKGRLVKLHRNQPPVRKRFVQRALAAGGAALLLFFAALYLPGWIGGLWPERAAKARPAGPRVVVVGEDPEPPPPPAKSYDKNDLACMIGPRAFAPNEIHAFCIEDENGRELFVQTTLDPDLQAWAVKFMPRVKARSAALVVMNPKNGEILSMASIRDDGRPVNVALASEFPAASLFKIITAAAALEKKEVTSGTTLGYDGGKYTLYKKHLKENIKKGAHKVTLEKSFAHSINTVFGKLGAFTLGPEALESFAKRFYFNQPIEFEMPVEKSVFTAEAQEDPYRLAELASGYNRTTKVSPLHGAMLASAVVNNGRLMAPTVVREVFDVDNRIFYRHQPDDLGQVVSVETVKELRKLMRATVDEGTGRRRFRDHNRHRVLKKLELGGKSGTINNDQGAKVDWFVCFAQTKDGRDPIALAAVVVHKRMLGMRAQEIIREAVIHYFKGRV